MCKNEKHKTKSEYKSKMEYGENSWLFSIILIFVIVESQNLKLKFDFHLITQPYINRSRPTYSWPEQSVFGPFIWMSFINNKQRLRSFAPKSKMLFIFWIGESSHFIDIYSITNHPSKVQKGFYQLWVEHQKTFPDHIIKIILGHPCMYHVYSYNQGIKLKICCIQRSSSFSLPLIRHLILYGSIL